MGPYYPEVSVKVSDQDGNAFMIIGRVQRALRKAGVDDGQIDRYAEEAMSGDYDNAIRTTAQWVEIY